MVPQTEKINSIKVLSVVRNITVPSLEEKCANLFKTIRNYNGILPLRIGGHLFPHENNTTEIISNSF